MDIENITEVAKNFETKVEAEPVIFVQDTTDENTVDATADIVVIS